METILQNLPQTLILGALLIVALLLLLLPLALRLAGLTGAQIVDTITLSWQFALNIVREFREQNKSPP